MASHARDSLSAERWPRLPLLEEWPDTLATLHMWTQIVGKTRLALSPMMNHWWQVPLYVTSRGLTTSPIPYGERTFEVEFDFTDDNLRVVTSDGQIHAMPLIARSVADFYLEYMAVLRALGVDVKILARPVEVEGTTPFAEDTKHTSYDSEFVHRFWRALVQADRVLKEFRARFLGKSSPVHFFWGGFDLAVTRFSGRLAYGQPGGAPNVAAWVMEEAYSHELSSAGFWPGSGAIKEATFFGYAFPQPEGFADWPVKPNDAFYTRDMGLFVLPYEAVRTAASPDRSLMEFLQTTYEAAAELAHWDRAALERQSK